MRTRLAAVALLLACGHAPAGVIVLANRATTDVTFAAADASPQRIAPYEQAVLFADGAVTVSFTDGKETRKFRVEPDTAYFFAGQPGELTLQGIGAGGGPAKDGRLENPPPLETITVRVMVDEEEPTVQSVWEARLRKRVAAAAEILERTCRVRLRVSEADTWDSDNRAADLDALITDFERKVPRGDARLTIGFSSQRTPEEGGTMHLGGTRLPLHSYILLREWAPRSEAGRLEVLLHELGHFLGAAHSPETVSVMRARLGDGRVASLRFPIGFDPLNTLAMNLVAGELRTRRVKSLAELSLSTRERLARIYRELQTAIPEDPTPPKLLALLQLPSPKPVAAAEPKPEAAPAAPDMPKPVEQVAAPPAPKPPAPTDVPVAANPAPAGKADRGELVEGARAVLAAVVKAAEENQRLPAADEPGALPPLRRTGDALTEYYVRAAASAARELPPDRAARAYLLGQSVALDTADLFRTNPVTGLLWRRVESDGERARRLHVLGLPTVHARHDSCQHFVDSAALVAVNGPVAAEIAGVLKEILDSRPGGSGFSFADLGSDLSGVAFAKHVLADPDALNRLAAGRFKVADYALPPDGLIEGLTSEQFASGYGSVTDDRFLREMDKLRQRVRDLPGYHGPGAPAPEMPAAERQVADARPPAKPAEERRSADIVPNATPPAKTEPVKPPAEPQADESTQPEAPPVPLPDVPWSVLVLAGPGVLALAGAAYAFRSARPAREDERPGRAPVVVGSALVLVGLGLLGGAYASWVGSDGSSVASFAPGTYDLEPLWSGTPAEPGEIPVVHSVHLPGFPGARAVWGATGRDRRGHVWFAVSAGGAEPSARLMEYDPDADQVAEHGDVLGELRRLGLFRAGQQQGAVHSRIALGADGGLYFASTSERGTAAAEGEGAGSHLWRLRPTDGRWEHLLAAPERLTAVACGGRYVFALGHSDHVLYRYSLVSGHVRSVHVGSVGMHASANFVADHRGHAYVPRLRETGSGLSATLVELDGSLHEVTQTPLDHYTKTARDDSPGLVAVQPLADRSLVFATDQGFLYRVIPGERDLPARLSPLGPFHPHGESEVDTLCSPDGQRYLMGLARSADRHGGPYQWLVFDLEKGRSVVVPLPPPTEAGQEMRDLALAGCMTRDDRGNFYAGGSHRRGGTDRPVLFQIRLPH